MNIPVTINYFDLVGQVKKSYGRTLEPVCQRWALTRNELDILLFLHNNPGYDRAADIVRCRGISKSHVSLSASTLEQRGLLARGFAPNDRRTAHLRLTEAGAAIAREGRAIQEEFFGRLFQGISREELLVWQQLTETIQQNIHQL